MKIPHDEAHRFLQWGPMDAVFNAWCRYFDSKGIKYDIGGGQDRWTIYKHMAHTEVALVRRTGCCKEGNSGG